MRILISISLLSLILLGACQFGSKKQERIPSSVGLFTAPIDAFDFEKVVTILRTSESKNVEEALLHLHKTKPEFFNYYSLVHRSNSYHQSTFQDPRVILFGPSSELILTFNGNNQMQGGDSLHLMQFEYETGELQFREIAFKNSSGEYNADSLIAESEIEKKFDNFRVTKANPQKCAACHGKQSRPLWEISYLWPGVYGSNDDLLTNSFYKKGAHHQELLPQLQKEGIKPGSSMGRLFKLKSNFKDMEAESYQKFILTKNTHPRYRFLGQRASDTAFRKLAAGDLPESIDTSSEIEREMKVVNPQGRYARYYSTPNLALGDVLNEMALKSFVAKSFVKAETRTLPYKILWLNSCSKDYYGLEAHWLEDFDHLENERQDPLVFFNAIISSGEASTIRRNAGPWRQYYRKFIQDEFAMTVAKAREIENTFGKNSLEATEYYLKKQRDIRDPKYYELLLGRKLDSLEEILTYKEIYLSYLEVASAYIAKGLGLDLADFATNSSRLPYFGDSGIKYVKSGIFNQSPQSKFFFEVRDPEGNTCQEILEKARF